MMRCAILAERLAGVFARGVRAASAQGWQDALDHEPQRSEPCSRPTFGGGSRPVGLEQRDAGGGAFEIQSLSMEAQ
jgi:hypothetical protein